DDGGGIFNCVDGEGPTVTQELILPPISGIKLKGSMDVFITQGGEQQILVEAQENIINEIDLDVDNGVWELDFEDCVRNHTDVKVFITMPEVEILRITGSGDIVGENVFTGSTLVLRITGSGDMDLAAEYDNLDTEITGSGTILLEGICDHFETKITGSGDYNAFNMLAVTGDVHITGSGDAEVNVSELLEVKISGSGDVFFKCDPIIDANITGSGEVVDAN
ncbi:MAG: DUF2807 domain-containing protein, partial [Phaeodactylibacter sp.]|nr:DUF2807 domain-containing protein [Phaeodactylibacter sp.]